MDGQDTPQQEPIFNIVGQKVALGPVRVDVLPIWLKWENDFEVTHTDGGVFGVMTGQTLEGLFKEGGKGGEVRFLVYELATRRPIGTTNLANVDHRHRRAEFGICIGEKDCRGKGYGSEAAALTLDYGFTGLGFHNIVLYAASCNPRGLRAFARAGFREVGRRREALRLGGRAYDEVVMDCLASEFRSPVLARLLPDD